MTQIEFNHQVKEHYKPLRGYALKLTQDPEDANDLVQETMLKAFNNKDKFQDGTNLKGWLYTIMKNIFINNYRRMVNGSVVNDNTENQYYLNHAGPSVKNEGDGRLVMNEVRQALELLNDNLRTPFEMSHQGYKYEEIAKYLAVPLGTVKIRIHVARQKLKKMLAAYGSEYGYQANS
ncbi:MAG: RNA polymerase sigma factor [Bacteroidia bacterium]|nr:RNA polymerase sigma factor [Bacteroidia bacterium]